MNLNIKLIINSKKNNREEYIIISQNTESFSTFIFNNIITIKEHDDIQIISNINPISTIYGDYKCNSQKKQKFMRETIGETKIKLKYLIENEYKYIYINVHVKPQTMPEENIYSMINYILKKYQEYIKNNSLNCDFSLTSLFFNTSCDYNCNKLFSSIENIINYIDVKKNIFINLSIDKINKVELNINKIFDNIEHIEESIDNPDIIINDFYYKINIKNDKKYTFKNIDKIKMILFILLECKKRLEYITFEINNDLGEITHNYKNIAEIDNKYYISKKENIKKKTDYLIHMFISNFKLNFKDFLFPKIDHFIKNNIEYSYLINLFFEINKNKIEKLNYNDKYLKIKSISKIYEYYALFNFIDYFINEKKLKLKKIEKNYNKIIFTNNKNENIIIHYNQKINIKGIHNDINKEIEIYIDNKNKYYMPDFIIETKSIFIIFDSKYAKESSYCNLEFNLNKKYMNLKSINKKIESIFCIFPKFNLFTDKENFYLQKILKYKHYDSDYNYEHEAIITISSNIKNELKFKHNHGSVGLQPNNIDRFFCNLNAIFSQYKDFQ